MQNKEYEVEIGGKKITAMFSDLADQANGSVILKSEGTVVMATAVISKDGSRNMGWFNLTVEYLEKFYAAGKILGGQYNKREGRPSDQAILAARMIDRTIRPLFDQHIKNAVQIIVTVIAVGKTDPKTLGINATSIALHLSDIPWRGPIGAVHLSKTKEDQSLQINNYIPSADESVYELDLLVCGKDKTINMIEAMSYELNEEEMGECFDKASLEISKWEDFQKKLCSEFGKEKIIFEKPKMDEALVSTFNEKIKPMLDEKLFSNESKKVTGEAENLWDEILKEKYKDSDNEKEKGAAEDYIHHYLDSMFHIMALEKGLRADGRKVDEIRKLFAKAGGVSEVLHGSGIFYRGETHVLSVLALGGPEDMQLVQGMESEMKKRFMHHYNFPPYSGGETGTEITIEEDGTVFVTGKNGGAEEAVKIIAELTHEYKVGDTAQATVVKLMDFGAFVRIGHDTEGLVHISEIAPFRVEKVSDILKEGDIVPIKIIKTDDKGRLSFSIKEADGEFFKKES